MRGFVRWFVSRDGMWFNAGGAASSAVLTFGSWWCPLFAVLLTVYVARALALPR